jgi:hypothetical protein
MKNILIVTLAMLTLSACGLCPTRPGADKIVYVDKAVPYCTAPPQVPQFTRLVDSLTPADIVTPGAVAKDYVYDMTVLRSQVKIYQEILDQYSKQTQDFSAVQAEIDKLQPPTK